MASRRACPVCGARFVRFAKTHRGERRACPRCDSYQRHRLLWLFLERHTTLLRDPARVLHFAPEPCLRARLRAAEHLDYVTGDLAPGVADLTLDIADIDLPDGDFDAVICSHVLEHVPDDRAALRELRRVLRPGGWAIVQVPLVLEATIEDPGLEDPEERAARFGQEDHVRIYGPEFLDRFREAGFELTVHSMRPELTEDEITRYGLDYTHPWLRDLPAVWEIYQGHRPG